MKKKLDSCLMLVVCYQQYEFKKLTEKTIRESAMQPKLWSAKKSFDKYMLFYKKKVYKKMRLKSSKS